MSSDHNEPKTNLNVTRYCVKKCIVFLEIITDYSTINVYANPGESAVLVCTLNETVQWRKDEKIISNNEKVKIFQNVLVINPEVDEDYGNYFCELRDYEGKGLTMKLTKINESETSTGEEKFLIPFIIVLIVLVFAMVLIVYLVLRSRRGLTTTIHRNPIAEDNEYGKTDVGSTIEMTPVDNDDGDYEDVNVLRESILPVLSSEEAAQGEPTYQDLSTIRDEEPVYQGLVDNTADKNLYENES